MNLFTAITILGLFFLVPETGRAAEPASTTSPVDAVRGKVSARQTPIAKEHATSKGTMTTVGQTGVGSQAPISGKVVEIFKGGGYTYIHLEKDGRRTWVAVPEAETKVGDVLTVNPGAEMTNFQSKSLNRTFDKIIFSDGVAGPAPDAHKQSATNTVPDQSPITGTILETMNSGGYTYVLLKRKGKDEKVWLAVPEMQVIVGKEMTFGSGMTMTKFSSSALNRTFETIIFSSGPIGLNAEKKDQALPEKSSEGKKSPAKKISVEKAKGANAYRVAELFGMRGKLDKKKVVVRGKVVRVSKNIMGKNWIHLQDGTGSPAKMNNDIVVTVMAHPKKKGGPEAAMPIGALPAEGDVVTATGILYKDKDFGAGYKYSVIIENATLVIQ